MNLRVYKLIDGQEIIAEWFSGDDAGMLKDSFILMPNMTPQGMSIGLMPLLMFSDDDCIDVQPEHILYSYNPDKRLKGMYEQALTQFKAKRSGLILPG